MAETESHWLRNIMILIVIALLLWQFILPMFMEVKTPLEYLQETVGDSDFSEAYWNMHLINQTTGQEYHYTGYYGYEQTMTQYHTYALGIETEGLPVNVLESMTWRVEIHFWNISISDWSLGGLFAFKIGGYEPLYTEAWYIPTESLYLNYEITYSISMTLLDYNGYPIPVKSTPAWTTQLLRLNDHLETAP